MNTCKACIWNDIDDAKEYCDAVHAKGLTVCDRFLNPHYLDSSKKVVQKASLSILKDNCDE